MSNRPAYRNRWEYGAKAYPEADTLEALAEGSKRKRKRYQVSMPFSAVGHLECRVCGGRLDGEYEVNPGQGDYTRDSQAKVTVDPKAKSLSGAHYYCGWGDLLQQVVALGRVLQYG